MADYIGNRRAVAPTSAEQAQRMFAEDDAASACPKCGATVRDSQEWCTLCLHVLHAPAAEVVDPGEPADLSEPVAPAVPDTPREPVETGEAELADEAGRSGKTAETTIDVDAAAQALLAQLAVETKRDAFRVPAFLNSKARVAVFVVGSMAALCVASLVAMGIVGKLFG